MKVLRRQSGFTLVEMLVVIVILGILAGLAVPALKNLGKSDATVSASRQLLDDVGRARQLAMNNHTTVYMVFVPTNFWGNLTTAEQNMAATTNLIDKQLTGYTFISHGTVGDQPGNHQWHYLAPWQSLPDGTFIAAQKFAGTNFIASYSISEFHYTNSIPFPTATNFNNVSTPYVYVPYIAFNYLGQLTVDGVNLASVHEYIPLARGSVSYGYDAATKTPQLTPVTANGITETPPGNSASSAYNIIDIDPLTGRATLLYQKVQ